MPSIPMSKSPSSTVLAVPAEGEESLASTVPPQQQRQEQPGEYPTLTCRNFWRAGTTFDLPSETSAAREELRTSDFAYARVHPKFLHTNATSHKWAFGAIAELLDNAVDEICNGSTFVKVDKVNSSKDNSPMLLFQDDGGGMDPEGMRGCMSLGFSTKKSKKTIGQYGNGFKTSTMRLGADVLVFSQAVRGSRMTQSIGLLSYTYLRRTMKDDIVVPMIDFEIREDQVVPLFYGSEDDWNNSLEIILDWSPFSSRDELLSQIVVVNPTPRPPLIRGALHESMKDHSSAFADIGSHGTKVVIYNLWMNDDGLLELDFDDDDEDILLRDHVHDGGSSRSHKEIVHSHISHTFKHSLRAYASILYLRKLSNFHIILRGKPVEQHNIADELKFSKVITYKPQVGITSEIVSVRTTIGFAKEAPVLGIFGFNVYHKNRLIMPFWKVLQEGSSRGRSVVGVLEANFMEPAHDKQDFERTPLFIRLEAKLKQMVIEYWNDNCHLIGYQSRSMRNTQKGSDKHSHGVKGKRKAPASQHVTELPASVQGSQFEEPVIELTDDFLRMPSIEPIIGLAAVNGSTGLPSAQAQVENFEADPTELGEVSEDVQAMEVVDPAIIEEVVEENLRLFGRCDELQRRETELKRVIEELEHELERTRKRCSQVASELEIRKGHHSTGQ